MKRGRPRKIKKEVVLEMGTTEDEPVEPIKPVNAELEELKTLRDGLVKRGIPTDSKLEVMIANLEK